MRTFMALLIALAFGLMGAMIATAAQITETNTDLAIGQVGLALACACFGTVFLVNFKS